MKTLVKMNNPRSKTLGVLISCVILVSIVHTSITAYHMLITDRAQSMIPQIVGSANPATFMQPSVPTINIKSPFAVHRASHAVTTQNPTYSVSNNRSPFSVNQSSGFQVFQTSNQSAHIVGGGSSNVQTAQMTTGKRQMADARASNVQIFKAPNISVPFARATPRVVALSGDLRPFAAPRKAGPPTGNDGDEGGNTQIVVETPVGNSLWCLLAAALLYAFCRVKYAKSKSEDTVL